MAPNDSAQALDVLLDRAAALALRSGCEVDRELLQSPPPIDTPSAVRRELAVPTGSSRLASLARGRTRVAIVTSDSTRAVPNRELLTAVLDELACAGLAAEAVTIVVGGGAHRPLDRRELRDLVGAELEGAVEVVAHDAHRSDCVSVGRTPLGNDVRINRAVADADLVIALGVVEVHEFAGFTGGRKSILPGVAAYESIIHNHSLTLLEHAAARPGVLAGNPIHEEMAAAARAAALEFVVNVVLDGRNQVVALAAGDPEAAHGRLVEFVRATQTLSTVPEADILVTGPDRPLDINFYQSVKSLVALEPLVHDDTTVVLFSSCREGMGSDELLTPFVHAANPQAVMRAAADDYTVERDHSYLLARFMARGPHVIAWCPGVAPDDLRTIGLESAATPEEAMTRAVERQRLHRARPRALLFPRPQRALLPRIPVSDQTSIPPKGCCT